ncbi:MAG: universal stress protein [Candidatus Binatia bacterium]
MPSLFRRILVPYDFSDHAARALRIAVSLAATHGGKLTVLHVLPPFQPVVEFPPGESWLPPLDLVPKVKKQLETNVARVLGRGRMAPSASCRVEIGDPAQRIVEAARQADVVVMATAGRTGLAHLVIGSVAEKVVRHSPAPVLTVRPAPARRTRRKA